MDSKHREQLIEKFSNLHGASGFEAKVRDAFIHEIEQLGLEYEIDHLGNVIGNLSKKIKTLRVNHGTHG